MSESKDKLYISKSNFLTSLNLIMFICSIFMFSYVLYSMENYNIKNKRKFTDIELNQLRFAEKGEVLESIRLINENFNQLYSMSYFITSSVPLLDLRDTTNYVTYTTVQLDSIFSSCKNKAKKRYSEKYEKAYSYYVSRSDF